MHEAALARQILAVVLERTATMGGSRVRRVRGWMAETEELSAASVAFHFEALARGSCAEGAALELRVQHVEARCRRCQTTYKPQHHLLWCPACGSDEGEVLGPVGLGIETLEIDSR